MAGFAARYRHYAVIIGLAFEYLNGTLLGITVSAVVNWSLLRGHSRGVPDIVDRHPSCVTPWCRVSIIIRALASSDDMCVCDVLRFFRDNIM